MCMYIPDPIEMAERMAENYADENCDEDDNIKCCICKKMVPIVECSPVNANPCSPPMCRKCTEAKPPEKNDV